MLISAINIAFWIFFGFIVYSYFGYALLLWIVVKFKRLKQKEAVHINESEYPDVTMFVAAFNEMDYLDSKLEDLRNLDYPRNKLHIVFVTDGSDDGSNIYLEGIEDVQVFHEEARKGKISAMNRGIQFVNSPIVVFSDCNTGLGKNSVRKIVELMADENVGCIAGEKRIYDKVLDSASGSGEGLYWKYESKLKFWESEISSVVGAAGELFAIRRELYEEVEHDTLLDDFIISLRIAMKGYTIKYDPEAYAIEEPSFNVEEELKRKVRIAAGAMQSIPRLLPLLNPFKFGWLSIQYISHKILRWTVVPLSLLLIFPVNLILALYPDAFKLGDFYSITFIMQVIFYIFVLFGWLLQNKKVKFKLIFVPYYFFITNLSQFLGYLRFMKGKQSVNWEKARRK